MTRFCSQTRLPNLESNYFKMTAKPPIERTTVYVTARPARIGAAAAAPAADVRPAGHAVL